MAGHPLFQLLLRGLLCLLCGLALGWVGPARAQGIESILAPGKLAQAHAPYEDDCKQCHVRLDRKAQDGLCMDCHKPVGADVRGKTGYHGHLPQPLVCKSCHTEHKGRDWKSAALDPKTFDHHKTGYDLHGKHEQVACKQCHVAGKKYREAAQDCNSCHKKDDKHKGRLGPQCADCHGERDWKNARFDHETTRFALTGKHSEAQCSDCHKDNVYKDTPKNCYACHRKIDEQKGHKGQFGEKCESCHSTKAWRPSSFNHDADTHYSLRGRHRSVTCKDCHSGVLYKDKPSQECNACHRQDDRHKGSLGSNCAACHSEKNWSEVARFDHEKTLFPLAGKHARVACRDCHQSPMYKEAAKDCIGCHLKDDRHLANLGRACGDCHDAQDWKHTQGRFQHQRTRFPLLNAHAAPAVGCNACHKDLASFRNTPLPCVACHKKDDRHESQLGTQCESCHTDRAWKGSSFNHGKSRFALTGRHIVAECKSCHTSLRYKDAPRDCYACHQKEDKHRQVFGVNCASCHSTRAWSTWSFDHNLRTPYRLESRHATLACAACHKQVAPAGQDAAPLGTACVACHRADDVHGGGFGPRCEQCHQVVSWKKIKTRVGRGADR